MSLGETVHRLLTREVPRRLMDAPRPACARSGPVTVRFLGTAGFELRAAGQSLLVDPYLSRRGLWRTFTQPLVPDPVAVRERVQAADHVFAGHSHHDHSLDVPEISRQTGARIHGSPTTLHLARAQGADPGLLTPFAAGDTVEAGPFRVEVVSSRHGLVVLGRVPLPGVLTGPPAGVPRVRHYREGGTFGLRIHVAGVTLMHLGSANFLPATLAAGPCDVLLLCIVGRQRTPSYTERVLQAFRPRLLIPCHFDDFCLPFGHPMRQLPGVALEAFLEDVEACGSGCEVAVLDFFDEVQVGPPAPAG